MDYFTITYGLGFISLIITLGASAFIKSTYNRYSKEHNRRNMTGAEAARDILDKNGLQNVYVVETDGNLTDHYDPSRKVIKLSRDVYSKDTISAVSVAAHECGHAIQDKDNYALLRIRSSIVPLVNFSSQAGYVILFIGIIVQSLNLIWVGILLEAMILVFQLVTLPVEIDASRRALGEIKSERILDENEYDKGKTVLIAAALTYVASVATAILEILRLVLIYGRDRKE